MVWFALGEVVAIEFWWGRHVGIIVGWTPGGEPVVAHCSRSIGYAAAERLSDFAGGRPVHRLGMTSRLHPAIVVQRALDQLGSRWSFRNWNCEDYVTFALGMPPRSPQREAVYAGGKVAATVLLLVGLARS